MLGGEWTCAQSRLRRGQRPGDGILLRVARHERRAEPALRPRSAAL